MKIYLKEKSDSRREEIVGYPRNIPAGRTAVGRLYRRRENGSGSVKMEKKGKRIRLAEAHIYR